MAAWREGLDHFLNWVKAKWSELFSVLFSGLLVLVVARQTCIMENTDKATGDAAEAAKISAKTARDALSAQRPWVVATGLPQIIEPLTFGSLRGSHAFASVDEPGAYTGMMFSLKNGGVSPALKALVFFHLKIQPINLNDSVGITETIKSSCNREVFRRKENIEGVLILPNDTVPFPRYGGATANTFVTNRNGDVMVWVITCVGYHGQFEDFHGIGVINTFITKDGRHIFKPEGTIDGNFQDSLFAVMY
jgi:hypothetical protein